MPSTASMVEINGLTTTLDSATGICFPANKRSVAAPLPVYRHGISFFRENLRKTIDSTSGSPILRNGKLVGAVTHVLMSDPQKGYGIFIENMLAEAEKLK